MKHYDLKGLRLGDTAAESVVNYSAQEAALESHLQALQDRHRELVQSAGAPQDIADIKLQTARTLVNLERGEAAWPLGREALDTFIRLEDFESAADACDVLFQSDQPDSLNALGQGIWLTVTYPMDPELSVALLTHVINETPDDADGAAVAATTALFLADIRASGSQRENLMFLVSQTLGTVARRHGKVDSQEAFDRWMERLEIKDPAKFLVRLRNVVDVLVQDNWWFDREVLQAKLPVN
ncbi:hypothetical protein [Candidatus Thiosymbion oneisti]|uniref:hypothetical protein n=1 Tax=Candidatus Thiosymbion oneisti TaxID=589554 RepID=UPI001061D0C2|nr:hypothetical protein [Candidatus Thiosymbion oneisti]